ncbi:MAG TPA: SNF2-related protein [Bacteroidota bacterium]
MFHTQEGVRRAEQPLFVFFEYARTKNRRGVISGMLITEEYVNEVAEAEIISAGRRLFHAGRVIETNAEEHQVAFDVTANGEVSQVQLFIDDQSLESSCTCGYDWGGACKHVVGGMLAIMYHQAGIEYTPAVSPLPDDTERTFHSRASYWADQIHHLLPADEEENTRSRTRSPKRLAYSIGWNDRTRSLLPLTVAETIDGSTSLPQESSTVSGGGDQKERYLLSSNGKELSIIISDNLSTPSNNGGESLPVTTQYVNQQVWQDVFEMLIGKVVHFSTDEGVSNKKAHVRADIYEFRLKLTETNGGLELHADLEAPAKKIIIGESLLILSENPLWVAIGKEIARVVGISAEQLRAVQTTTLPMYVPFRDKKTFFETTIPSLMQRFRVECDIPSLVRTSGDAGPMLYLVETAGLLQIELRFRYGSVEVKDTLGSLNGMQSPFDIISKDEEYHIVERDRHGEQAFRESLIASGVKPRREMVQPLVYTPTVHPLEWLHTKLPALQRQGFEVFAQNLKQHRLRQSTPLLRLRVSSGIDWFDLKADVDFDGAKVPMNELLKTVERGERFVKLGDDSYGVLPDEWVAKFRRTIALGERNAEGLTFSRAQIGALDELLIDADEVDIDQTFEEMRGRLRSFSGIGTRAIPEKFNGELRPYQKSGYDWLFFLKEFSFGGILADDMGLGKTIQTLALLQKVYEEGELKPSLVVVPTSLIFNWQNEAEKFTPSLRVLAYSGYGRSRYHQDFDQFQIIITSYGILRRDVDLLAEMEFCYLVLDESQNIKNPVSQNARASRQLQAAHRLALTGTPVENNLMDLWSQFAFLNKGMLGGEHTFADHFANPIERQSDKESAALLKKIIFPFILRRTKDIVAEDLPPKQESVVMCDMDAAQRAVYYHWRDHFRAAILQSIDEVGMGRSKLKVLEGLTKLRQVCCHPALVENGYEGSSGKFEAFAEMLDDIIAEGHKVLVFSQFVRMLTILRRHCDDKAILYEYLDGRTTNREKCVEHFQEDESIKLFLISLKAGGTGLNLTAADYVIHYDPWWNPAVEIQATDRTHRIGQTKHVFSYKLITKESVEEKILELQEKKKLLVKEMITTDSGLVKSLTREDIDLLFG